MVLLVSSALLSGTAHAAERTRPFRIGALTESWGPTPAIVALRDGLLELGYRENEQFVLASASPNGIRQHCPPPHTSWSSTGRISSSPRMSPRPKWRNRRPPTSPLSSPGSGA